jgi:hypothetical protein
MAGQHDLVGQGDFYDRTRRVLLSAGITLEIANGEARLVIGKDLDDPRAEIVRFNRPPVVSALSILAQMIEATENPDFDPDAPTPLRRIRLRWQECPRCDGDGGIEDRHGNWHDCELCEGAGVCRLD